MTGNPLSTYRDALKKIAGTVAIFFSTLSSTLSVVQLLKAIFHLSEPLMDFILRHYLLRWQAPRASRMRKLHLRGISYHGGVHKQTNLSPT